MDHGCAGLSSGLIYSPGSYAERAELVALASVAAEYGGFYATHMRNEGPALLAAVEEALTIASSSGAGLQLSHHKVLGRSNWGLTKRSLARIAEAQAAGMDVLLDQYPYNATSTTLTALLPTWMLEGGIASMQERLRDDQTRAAARAEVLSGPTDGRPKRDFEPETVTIASVHSGRRNNVEGHTIADLARAADREPVDYFLDLLRDEGGGIEVVIAAIGEDDIRRVMRNPTVAVASDGLNSEPGRRRHTASSELWHLLSCPRSLLPRRGCDSARRGGAQDDVAPGTAPGDDGSWLGASRRPRRPGGIRPVHSDGSRNLRTTASVLCRRPPRIR